MEIYTTDPLEIPAGTAGDEAFVNTRYDRADLIFYNVDHSGPSYTARVFLNNPEANIATELLAENGYAGCFTIFGHAGCVGTDDDHCNPLARTVDEYDFRPPHPLLPQTKLVTVTQALQRLGSATEVRVTIVPVVPGDTEAELTDALKFSNVRLATYRYDGEHGDAAEEDWSS
jgi:tyrosinase